ncbi:hypothetical protein [Hymenobacter ruricola]|uniref:Phage abortive infection protein n=1 Tax=Hymenobacter ruricola TaxID=2791023 RepID=A0ABS0I0N8_9BACT|nr:hypothetical protein [Hymenobacter ruricola]MBF9220505.1 hypothetical protein [Hymenobacter ruricola]
MSNNDFISSLVKKLAATLLHVSTLLLLIAAPFCIYELFLQTTFLSDLIPHVNTTLTEVLADIGGFYGGVLGPIVTAIGLYFIYYTYRTQLKETERAQINKLYADVLEDINSIQYRKREITLAQNDNGVLFEGVDALFNYDGIDGYIKDSVLNHVNLIVLSLKQLMDRIEKSRLLDKRAKTELMNKACLLCYAKIAWPVFQGIYQPHGEYLLLHPDFGHLDTMFYTYETLTKRTVKHLLKEKFIRFSQLNNPAASKSTGFKPRWAVLPFLAESLPEIVNRKTIPLDEWQEKMDRWVQNSLTLHNLFDIQLPTNSLEATNAAYLVSWRGLAKFTTHSVVNALPLPIGFKVAIVRKCGSLWKI